MENTVKEKRFFEGHAPDIALIDGDYKVEWVDLGEGLDGYYDAKDPDDIELLRFDFSFKGETVSDGSYCTLMPVNTPEDILKKGLEKIMDEVKGFCHEGSCPKKILEEMSWIEPKWVE